MTLLAGLLVLSLQAPALAPGAAIYRYIDRSGQEHFIDDPSLAPPEAKDSLQPVDLTHSSETTTPARADTPPPTATGSDAPAPTATKREVHWRQTWLWASVVAAVLFFILAVLNGVVPSRYQRASWALSVGRLVSVFLLVATLIAASYELRNDPTLRRYSPWAALDQFQQTQLEAIKRTALQEHAAEPDAKKSGQAR